MKETFINPDTNPTGIEVSVIVPNYNYARYLPQRIESILNQSYTGFELILLDDASTDNSVTVFEQYKENPHITAIIVNEKNTGSPFCQWMKGIEQAKGKYIWIAEADDSAAPSFLKTCMDLIYRHPDAAICYVGSHSMDGEGNINPHDINHWKKESYHQEYAYFDGKLFAEHNLYWRNYLINASGILFRKEDALKLKDSPFLQFRYCGDWLFWFQIAMQGGGIIEIYKKLNYFRQHNNKLTTTSRRLGGGFAEDIKVVHYMEQALPHLDKYKKRLRHGMLYRKIKRLSAGQETKEQLFQLLSDELHADKADYRLERRNQILRLFLPSLTTWRRDRL